MTSSDAPSVREARATRSTDAAGDLSTSSLTDDVSFLLARANALSLAAGNAALAPHGLKVRSYSVLALVADGARPSQRELAAFLRLDPSQVVALVDDLQRRGLVERRPDPADRRANVVRATDAGRALHALALESARVAERTLHADLDERERAQLAGLLRRIAFSD
ncbi:MarR family winged helix-turn-helix transcriptional regulator [Microbacterium sp. cx-59]|uniref:MarR family winged helix-turn-helix transcriptional regulator n=1 Tax=Microbacterium sp. cx-59 TaxID=2891207 RepID=UPI001E388DD7|nr:MarR family winged helix-turn-helix transcriptional regulator [Microbacterium sp. cx-59]MCC4909411.1 MarR family winged helix-turn-helix transcriptional regulator [Microbacterium sp. cx-59]